MDNRYDLFSFIIDVRNLQNQQAIIDQNMHADRHIIDQLRIGDRKFFFCSQHRFHADGYRLPGNQCNGVIGHLICADFLALDIQHDTYIFVRQSCSFPDIIQADHMRIVCTVRKIQTCYIHAAVHHHYQHIDGIACWSDCADYLRFFQYDPLISELTLFIT